MKYIRIRPVTHFNRRDVLLAAGTALGGVLAPMARVFTQQSEEGTEPAVWRDMNQAELDAAYENRNYAPNMDRLAEQKKLRNAAAIARLGPPLEFAYGSGPMETLDIYRTDGGDAPVHIYLHGGTWRFNTAAEFAYLAEPFVHNGATMVLVDFAFVEEVQGGLPVLVKQVRDAVAWTYRNATRFGGDPERIYVSGHSSGGHLAGTVLTTNWREDYDLPPDLVKGGMCVSGIYDLEPVRLSSRNSYLNLTDELVEALSPQRHIDQLQAPLIVAFGTYETPEFQRQARDFAAAVEASGKLVQMLVGIGYNHFEIRDTLANEYGLLGNAALEQMGISAA